MRKLCLVVSGVLAACGGDDGSTMVDARPISPPSWDLSCKDYAPATAPNPIDLALTLLNLGSLPNPPPVPMTTIEVYSVDGTTMLASGTSDDMGAVNVSLPSNGVPTRYEMKLEPMNMPKLRLFVANPAWTSGSDNVLLVPQLWVDGLYTALGATADPAKGTLIVLFADCSGNNMTSVTPSIEDDATATWAMYGGVGAWLPRPATVSHPQYLGFSVAGTVNVAPGPHTVHAKYGASEVLTPSPIVVDAGAVTTLFFFPGVPRGN